jgi:hypothetical protein
MPRLPNTGCVVGRRSVCVKGIAIRTGGGRSENETQLLDAHRRICESDLRSEGILH